MAKEAKVIKYPLDFIFPNLKDYNGRKSFVQSVLFVERNQNFT